MKSWLAIVLAWVSLGAGAQDYKDLTLKQLDEYALQSTKRWQESKHGQLLERMLPQRLTPSQLPKADSLGARLTSYYCVQCHHLVNPAMHNEERWAKLVERMVPRMQGKGNYGKLMAEMMVAPTTQTSLPLKPLQAPSAAELKTIVAYLGEHGQAPLTVASASPALRKALVSPIGEQFEQACSQCHQLPDPRRYRAEQWPAVVKRMEKNMSLMNKTVGSKRVPGEPQLQLEEITRFLQVHAKR